jgi:hypothetical protein
VTDALGHATRTDYDTTYHQFPVVVTNAEGQTSHTEYRCYCLSSDWSGQKAT